MALQVVSPTLLLLIACAVRLAAGGPSAAEELEEETFATTGGDAPPLPGSETPGEVANQELREPGAKDIKWWLADHTTLGTFGTVLLVLYAVGFALLVLLLICVSAALLGRSCWSCCSGDDEDMDTDQQLAPHQRARLSNYPSYPSQYPPGYQPVQQRDMDPDLKEYGTGKDNLQKPAAGSMGGMRVWCGALCLFCCGALVSGVLLGSGAVIWWHASGSPALAGLPGSNITTEGHQARMMEQSDHEDRHLEESS